MTRQKKQNDVVNDGEVIMVPREKVVAPPPPVPTEIAPSTLNKLKPKRELSEKQKENLARLIEQNKKRAQERRGVVTNNIPETIPEDMILLKVKPKRAYNKKVKEEVKEAPKFDFPSESESEPEPKPKPRKKYTRVVETETETETEVEMPRSPPKLKRTYKKKAPPAPRHRPLPDTETSDWDSSDSEEEEIKVDKYVAKTYQRMEALKEIERKMNALKNPYERSGMSVF